MLDNITGFKQGWDKSYNLINLVPIGFEFKIKHCDGYIVHEKVFSISSMSGRFYYTCESCACYSCDDLKHKAYN